MRRRRSGPLLSDWGAALLIGLVGIVLMVASAFVNGMLAG